MENYKVNTLCDSCNEEFELVNSNPNPELFTSTYQSCPHCKSTNYRWINITKKE